jgi:hypothetical protein
VTESDDFVSCQIAADHPLRQARLERLIDDAAATYEIDLAAAHESAERNLFRNTAALGVKDPDRDVRSRGTNLVSELYLSDALASIATVLLQDARAARRETRGEPFVEVFDRWIEIRLGTPAQLARAIEHLLDAQLENDVRVGAHPYPPRGDLSQQRVKPTAVFAATQRVYPNEHAVHREEAHAHRFLNLLGIQHWFCGETQSLESGEN